MRIPAFLLIPRRIPCHLSYSVLHNVTQIAVTPFWPLSVFAVLNYSARGIIAVQAFHYPVGEFFAPGFLSRSLIHTLVVSELHSVYKSY